MTVTKKTMINDIIAEDPQAARFFFEMGMFCVGCPSAAAENLEQACQVHGIEAAALVEKLNEYFAAKK